MSPRTPPSFGRKSTPTAFFGVCVWLLVLSLTLGPAHAADPPAKLTARVSDTTGTLSAAEIASLDATLAALEARKGSQLVVRMVSTTQPDTIEAYALALAEANRVGREDVDDGVLLLVAKDDRKVRIEVGYGLEGAIPDAIASRVIREYIAPRFRTGDFFGGIKEATDALVKLIDGEPLPPALEHERRPGLADSLVPALFFGVIFGTMVGGMLRRAPVPLRSLIGGGIAGFAAKFALGALFAAGLAGVAGALVAALSGRSGRFAMGPNIGPWIGGGGYGGGGRSGGGGGGFGGGGFSGGGGSFGGGGASGSW